MVVATGVGSSPSDRVHSLVSGWCRFLWAGLLRRGMTLATHPPVHMCLHLQVPQRFLMGPGPGNADPRALVAQSLPLLGHM